MRVAEAVELVGVSAYLVGAGVYLRVRGRLRPSVGLPRLALRAARVRAGRVLGRREGPLGDIVALDGHAYVARLPLFLPAASDEEGRSTLLVLEDGRPLGPAHSAHADVQARGGGRFSHWRRHVVFSTSDNSDPRSNGRRYDFRVLD